MARNIPIQALRTTRAALTTQAGASGLLAGEPYLITDENRIAMGTATNAYSECVMDADIGTTVSSASIEQIAGINPTLDLDFSKQSYRVYDGANGLKTLTPATLLTDLLTFTRASPATYFDAMGVMQSAADNVPRIDYDPATGECKGLLIEEARTNLLLNSLLDGTSLATQSVTVTAVAHTLSFYGTGTVTLSGTHVATVVGTGAYPTRTTLTFTPTAGTLTLTVSGTVQFANCGIGAFATSFIPTAGTSLTRTADVANIAGTNFSKWYRQDFSSLLLRADVFGAGLTYPLAIGKTSTATRGIGWYSDGVSLVARVRNDTDSVTIGATIIPVLAFRTAIGRGAGNNSFILDGAVISASNPNIGPVDSTICALGSSPMGSNVFTGHIAQFAFFPQRLPNATLQALTAE